MSIDPQLSGPATGPAAAIAQPGAAFGEAAQASALPAPTLTMPKVQLGEAAAVRPSAAPTLEALRERLQRAALLAREGKAQEALSEFEAVYTNYLTLGDPGLAPIGAKAAYNRGVLLEKLLGDAPRAEIAFEKLYTNFAPFDTTEIRTVVARSGLHAARLAGVLNRLALAVKRYADRLGPYGEYLPPLELRGFIADYRRLRAELREQEQGLPQPSGLPEIVEPGTPAQFAPAPFDAHGGAGRGGVADLEGPPTMQGFFPPAPPAAAALAPAGTPTSPRLAATTPPAPAATRPSAQPPIATAPAYSTAPAPAARAGLERTRPSPRLSLAETAARLQPPPPGGPTTTVPRVSMLATAEFTREELHARLDAMDRRMAAYVADVRAEVAEVRTAFTGMNAVLVSLQSQHLQLRAELQAQHVQMQQDWQARHAELREDQRSIWSDARADLRALAAEQRSTRAVLIATMLAATAVVVAVAFAFH